jgi:hypothetical protein
MLLPSSVVFEGVSLRAFEAALGRSGERQLHAVKQLMCSALVMLADMAVWHCVLQPLDGRD